MFVMVVLLYPLSKTEATELIRSCNPHGDFANRTYQTAILVGSADTRRTAHRRPDCLDHRDRRQCARAANRQAW
jgi:hypothetical protein